MNGQDIRFAQIARAAQLYYHNGKSQKEIAKELNLTRTQVSRWLTEAKQREIVSIVVEYPWRSREREKKLLELTSLKDVRVVVPDESNDYVSIQETLGNAAAQYFETVVSDGEIIAVSWGTPIQKMVAYLPVDGYAQSQVVQLIGASGSEKNLDDGPMLATQLAKRIGCNCRQLHAPLIVNDRSIRDALMVDKTIQYTLGLAETAKTAWVGIGSPVHRRYSLLRTGYISRQEAELLVQAGIIGDVCAHLYDRNGEVVDVDLGQRTVGITREALMRIPRVIGVSGGTGKSEAIIGALRGKLVNVLITDSITADRILEVFS